MELEQNQTFSPKQVARAIGVSEASIKRWCDKGTLSFSKTAGGHRRLHLHAVLSFLKGNGFELAQPEVLGVPASVGLGSRTVEQACALYRQAVEQGDEATCFRVALDMSLAGHDLAVIGDRVIASAFHALGDRWEHGDVAVYQERRGVEITRRVLFRLKDTLTPPSQGAPIAVGSTLDGDPYSLPGQLAELVLLELGWQASFFGSGLPGDTVAQAVTDLSPRLLWLSISSIEQSEAFLHSYRDLHEICQAKHCAVVVGGCALTESVRQQIRYAAYGDNLQHLRAFAQSLYNTA